jgi:hypothetical protein
MDRTVSPGAEVTSMRSSERLVALGGIGLAVASFVPWYEPDEFAFEGSRTNGWEDPDAFLSQLGTVAGVVLAVVVVLVSRQADRPTPGNLRWGTWLTIGGVVSFGAVALKYLLNMEGTTVGVYLALAAAVTQLYGGYITYVEDKERSGVPGEVFPIARPKPREPSVPPATTSVWPETAYFLSAFGAAQPNPDVALVAYRQAFAADQARQWRLLGEVQALVDPARPETERYQLLATYAPGWAGWPAHQVFGHLARVLAERPAP